MSNTLHTGGRGRAQLPAVALALQGGGSHGAFTWGVLDRLLESVEGRFRIAAISGASAGGINAALTACGLASGGPQDARARLRTFWTGFSRTGLLLGNPLLGFAEPAPFGGLNIDWSPMAIALEAIGLVVSPYTNIFYTDPLTPIIREALPEADLGRLNGPEAPQVFISATDISTNQRVLFTQPHLTVDALRASACLPELFRTVQIDKRLYWDGGYLGNPAVTPLVDFAQDLLIVVLNPMHRNDMPPISARGILDRLNEITFNASLVLELNGIEAVNRVLDAVGPDHGTHYKPIRFHMIENDAFMATLGFVSKNSTSALLIDKLYTEGRATADRWLARHVDRLGRASSINAHDDLIGPMLNARYSGE
ncbi:MAG: patatin-like phospholipase family protein [Acetobacteraceae bacterium]|nr:patatin-like phospholipase family protein [Acetobacteraceae bacterium]